MSSWCPSPYSSSPPKEERAGGARFPAEGRSARPVELLPAPPHKGWRGPIFYTSGRSSASSSQRVRFLYREMYDRQEFLRFDSDFGKHVVVTVLGEADAENFNSNKQFMQHQKAAVDHFCRHNYKVFTLIYSYPKPTVTISPTKLDPASLNTILLCTARGFYPLEIEIQWLKNGKLEEEGVAFGEELQNGDWTYQLQVMLETQPQRGDIYNCQVGHISLEAPITVQWAAMDPPGGWRPRSSSSARSKLWTGIMGAVIGAVFLAVGLFSYLKSKKARSAAPSILGWRVERSP
uniref:Ig-like domain-containing protein n=1 Tax=Pseudonaja textilis TaxID=8673 RepID=A0A670ZQX8_PSETE